MWKSVNLNFGQVSLNLTQCAVPLTANQGTWTLYYTRAVWFLLNSLAHNCYTWKLTAGRN